MALATNTALAAGIYKVACARGQRLKAQNKYEKNK
jgi:hypothetical protein